MDTGQLELRSAVAWRDGRLEAIDQTLLPERLVVLELRTVAEVVDAVRRRALEEAERVLEEDRASCRRMAEFGRTELTGRRRLLTHCNTGRLATAGLGTALGVVYAMAAAGEPVQVLASETRPLLQGARLTAWELLDAGIPVTVLAEGAAGAAMARG